MNIDSKNIVSFPSESTEDILTSVLREGARKLLAEAIEAEVSAYIDKNSSKIDKDGRRLVTRNGYHPAREIQSGIGPVEVKAPRVNDRRCDEKGERVRFSSSILPPYLRKTKSVAELVPWLYLKGVSTGDFSEALSALLGKGAKGFSASTVTRLKACWGKEFEEWSNRRLDDKHYVYWWADGIHFNIRLGENDRMCFLVILGATADGKKELVAVVPGYRESKMSWQEVLISLRDRGLKKGPQLAVGDGALGFWAAMEEVYPSSKQQTCWVHKTANVLDKLPKSKQSQAKSMIHNIYGAGTKKEATKAYKRFIEIFEAKYPRAVNSLRKYEDRLLSFYDFPAQHWTHIRTTNPIESTFATVRLRTKRTKGCGSTEATTHMVFKLIQNAQKNWRRLQGHRLLADVIDIKIKFVDGERSHAA
ncbi:MAG: IS256 family transposase [Zetaproteobacteria bacterium]|nr:IS256 family transposase [Zetaproteobacteria bacterium]